MTQNEFDAAVEERGRKLWRDYKRGGGTTTYSWFNVSFSSREKWCNMARVQLEDEGIKVEKMVELEFTQAEANSVSMAVSYYRNMVLSDNSLMFAHSKLKESLREAQND